MRRTLLSLLFTAASASLPAVNVFRAGDGGVPQFRIPALVTTDKGTLIAMSEARYHPASDCGAKFIAGSRSTDNGATWSPLFAVVGATTNSTSTGNPMVVWHPPTRSIVLVYAVQNLPAPHGLCSPSAGVFVVTSADDGVTWSTARNISGMIGFGAGHTVPGPGAGVVLTQAPFAGRIVMSGTNGPYGFDTTFYSDDGGVTWQGGATKIARTDESTLVELTSIPGMVGTVLLNMRTDRLNSTCDCRAYALSQDGGASFGQVAFDPELIEPVCQGSLLRLGDGSVLFANPASVSARANVTVRHGTGLPGGWSNETIRVLDGDAWGGYTSMSTLLTGGAGILFEHEDAGGVPLISFSSLSV